MVKIVTAVVNNPVFIEIQYNTLKKYYQGEYEFIVFNDAKDFPDFTNEYDPTVKSKIENVCRELNIKIINIPNERHKFYECPVQRCSDSMNFILEYQKNNPDKYLLLDSDMFLIDYFNISAYEQYDCAVVLQSRDGNGNRIHYFWNGIYYFDTTKMKNMHLLNWNSCEYCDVGGMMTHWLNLQMGGKKFPDVEDIIWTKNVRCENIYFMKHLWSLSWNMNELPSNLINNSRLIYFLNTDPRNVNGKFFCEIYGDKFLHYRAGGNWNREGMNFHSILSEKLKNFLL